MNVNELRNILKKLNYDTGIVSFNEGEKIGGFNIQNVLQYGVFILLMIKGMREKKSDF